MSIEQSPNRFRASLKPRTDSPVVGTKTAKIDKTVEGLTALPVARSETRRSNARADDRHRLPGAGATVRKGRRNYDVTLINISDSGAMVEGNLSAKLWQTVSLALGDVGGVECAVRWIRGNRYGLEFAHETNIDCDPVVLNETLRKVLVEAAPEEEEELIPEVEVHTHAAEQAERRGAATRHPLIWSGLIRFNQESFIARLRNISATGAQVQSTGSYPAGSEVLLDLGNAGTIPALVRWSHGAHSGLVFEHDFDVRKLSALQPTVTPHEWVKPDYILDESPSTSPWASEWGRLTLKELARTLCG